MKTCQTCKYWRKIRNENYKEYPGPHGECLAISGDTVKGIAWIWGTEEDNNDSDLSLVTQPNFGCTLWEEKNEL